MDRFQSLLAFTKVVEAGSFAGAAERLDRSVSAVSRQVSEPSRAKSHSRLVGMSPRSEISQGCELESAATLAIQLRRANRSADVGARGAWVVTFCLSDVGSQNVKLET